MDPVPGQLSPLFLTTSHLAIMTNERLVREASGFFWGSRTEWFLVSNKHVFARGTGPGATVQIRLHRTREDLTLNKTVELPLFDLSGHPKWRESGSEPEADIAALPFDAREVTKDTVIRAFNNEGMAREEAVELGDQLLIIGYPFGQYDRMFNLPIGKFFRTVEAS